MSDMHSKLGYRFRVGYKYVKATSSAVTSTTTTTVAMLGLLKPEGIFGLEFLRLFLERLQLLGTYRNTCSECVEYGIASD